MYQALYRKYRPKTFDDVVGQNIIITTLTNSILNDKINHAYLFTGPRGTGKTSIAKILAKLVNCESPNKTIPCDKCVSCTQIVNGQNTDIVEIDAASNNGVDEIRELRDKVNLVPSYGKYKVYIIDEVHMLTTAAFNALLKTLEEPPKHIIFILATTEPHKIPVTILSRCQRYDFKKISNNDIIKRLSEICKQEKIKIDEKAIELIAKLSDGGMRDSIGLLDQLTAYTNEKITLNHVHEVYGTITHDEITNFLTLLLTKNLIEVLNLIDLYDDSGKNLNKIIESLIEFLKNSLIFNISSDYFKNEYDNYFRVCSIAHDEQIYNTINILVELLNSSKGSNNIKLLFDLSIIKIINYLNQNNTSSLSAFCEEKVLDEQKKIVTEHPIIKKSVDDNMKEKLDKLKKIRINNTLAKFDRKQLLSFKKDIDSIRELLMDPKYSSNVSLILDGQLKAVGDKNLIFVYKVKNLEECFNVALIEIGDIFEHQFGVKYIPIAVTTDEWETIKSNFNKGLKNKQNNLEYKDEENLLNEIYNSNKKVITKTGNNEIENMFDDIVVYN